MLGRFFAFTPLSGGVTFLINHFVPDIEERIWWFILFGLVFFGITWAVKEIDELLGGVFIGAIAGALVTMIVLFAEENLVGAEFIGSDLLYITCKWIVPIIFYSGGASFPWME